MSRFEQGYRMPGYTGHTNGLSEVFGKTPVHAQQIVDKPSMTHTHQKTFEAQRWADKKDACNERTNTHAGTHRNNPNIWPNEALPTVGRGKEMKQELCMSSLALGDKRYMEPLSHYAQVHSRPGSARQTGLDNGVDHCVFKAYVNPKYPKRFRMNTPAQRAEKYKRVKAKVDNSPMPIEKLLDNLRVRFRGKINTMTNANGFKFRNVFRFLDENDSGGIEFEEFIQGLQQFGLQFEDYQALALFSLYDMDDDGLLSYSEFMENTLDKEYYYMAFAGAKYASSKQKQFVMRDTRKEENNAYSTTESMHRVDDGFYHEQMDSMQHGY